MSEIVKIILTSSLTILGGVLVFVIGQVISRFSIEPVYKQKRIVGDITYNLMFFAGLISSPSNDMSDKRFFASDKLRDLSCRLVSNSNIVESKSYWLKAITTILVRGNPISQTDVHRASRQLIGISNRLFNGDPNENSEKVDELKRLLEISNYEE